MTRSTLGCLLAIAVVAPPGITLAQEEAGEPGRAGASEKPLAGEEAVPATPIAGNPTPAAAAETTPAVAEEQRIEALVDRKLAEREAARMSGDEQAGIQQPKLRIYGFMDAGLQYVKATNKEFGDAISKPLTFVSGNTNVYLDANPSESWRSLIETRLMLYPYGSKSGVGSTTTTDTHIVDETSASGRNSIIWSGIVLERAWMQWTYGQHLVIQTGYLLTPFGIWNLDHGTPTLISLVLPELQLEEAIPSHQTGLQAFGSHAWQTYELVYHAYVGNGRTAGLLDTKWQKAFGGRLILRHAGEARAALGASGYYGRVENREMVAATSGFGFKNEVTVAYDEYSVGADLSVDWGGLRVRTEAMVRHIGYDDGKHASGAMGVLDANRYAYFLYLIVAQRFARYFEPYIFLDYVNNKPVGNSMMKTTMAYSGGLNLIFTPITMLKMQYSATALHSPGGADSYYHNVAARLVVVF